MTPARIRQIRDKLGLTNAQLAATCGVSVQTVYGWLRPSGNAASREVRGAALVLLDLLERRAGNDTEKTDA